MTKTTFNPDRLTALIQARHLTEYSLASLIGYSRQSINQWTRGITVPPVEALVALCDALDVQIVYFFPPPPGEIPAYVERNGNPVKNDPPKKSQSTKKRPSRAKSKKTTPKPLVSA
jgi:transcriptional regulator with XRE-family HTH domain